MALGTLAAGQKRGGSVGGTAWLGAALLTVAGCGGVAAPLSLPPERSEAPMDCSKACQTLPQGSCWSQVDCVARCSDDSPSWSAMEQEAFVRCVTTRPLCFERLEDCVLGELLRPDDPVALGLSGRGFFSDEGKVVRVWHDPDRRIQFAGEGKVVEGRFDFEWRIPYEVAATGPLLLLYLDEDGDGRCDPAVDRTHAAHAEWNGSWRAPRWTLELSPPLADPDFVCGTER